MIIQSQASNEHELNVGRPNVFNEEDRRFWIAFHQLVETCSQPIVVNGAYYNVRDIITTQPGYGGGGFAYKFWFESEEDKNEFSTMIRKL